jgi:hypothetical protein
MSYLSNKLMIHLRSFVNRTIEIKPTCTYNSLMLRNVLILKIWLNLIFKYFIIDEHDCPNFNHKYNVDISSILIQIHTDNELKFVKNDFKKPGRIKYFIILVSFIITNLKIY